MTDDDYDLTLDKIEAEVEAEYLRQIESIVASVDLASVDASVEADRGEVVVRMIEGAAFLGLMEALRRAFLAGGRVEMAALVIGQVEQAIGAPGGAAPSSPLPSLSYSFRQPQTARDRARAFDFDPRRQSAADAIARQAQDLADKLREAQRAAVQLVVQAGNLRGQPARQTALDLIGRVNRTTGKRTGGVIGLGPVEARASENARDQLLSGDVAQMREYLKRARRNRAFDDLVQAAIAAKRENPGAPPIARKDVDRIVGSYADRLLQGRAKIIAVGESTRALNGGRVEVFQQLASEGGDPAVMLKTWRHRGDERVRDSHREMGGQTVRIDQPFVTPRGARLNFPGDDSLGAPDSETAGCRCRLKFKIARTANV